jgi:hypothetical protein
MEVRMVSLSLSLSLCNTHTQTQTNIHTHTGCYEKSFTNLKAYINYSEDMCSVLNCHNVGKHTEFYLGQSWFDMTSIGNAADVPPIVSFLPHTM